MKKLVVLILMLIAVLGIGLTNINAQAKYHKINKDTTSNLIFVMVDVMPVFPGGNFALQEFISDEIKYPVIAQKNGIQGRVYVSFIIEKDGRISSAKVIHSITPYLDREAIRVISKMPRWKPGMQKGKKVRVQYTVPIKFSLK